MTKKIDEKIMETVRKMDAYLSVSKEINNKMSTESVREFLQMVLSIISNTKDDFDTLSESRMEEIEEALSYIVEEYKTMCADMDGKNSEATKKITATLKSAEFLLEQVKADRENLMEDIEEKMEATMAQCKVDHNGMMAKMDEYKKMIPSPYVLKATEVRDELQSLKGAERLDISAIKGIDELEKRLMAQIQLKAKPVSAGYRGGNYGIKSIKAGNNITITYNGDPSNGDITITATGGGGGGGSIDGSGTADELSYWVDSDTLGSLAVATYPNLTEVSYLKGATSAVQTQLNAKAPSTAPTFATSITGSYLTASTILITDGSKNIISATTATYPSLTEFSYVKGVTSAIQTQINTKAPSTSPTFATSLTASYATATTIAIFDGSKNLISADTATYPSLTELSYGKGVTSAIQTQLNTKAPSASPTFTGTVTIPQTPSNNTDAASKGYVDAVAQGLSVKGSVLLATASALPTNTYLANVITITATGTLTVDGTVTALNDRILVKDESSALKNGIYTVTTAGAIGVAAVLTRSSDMDVSTEFPGAFVFVETGTVNSAAGFVCTNSTAPTLGTTAINFTQFSGAGQITAGAGMTKTGNTLDVVGTSNRILVNADSIDISASYVGQTSITTLGTITTGVWNGTTIAVANGGTGITAFGTGVATALGINVGSAGAFITFNGALGTPSSGTLTNATGLPIAGLVASTSTAIGVGSIELGHATDTTIARVSAGVVSIEGVNILTTSSTATVTNKRITKRVYTATNNASLTPEIDTYDIFHLTAMSANTTINNHSTSTPTDGELMTFRFLDNATPRTLTWGSAYVAKGGIALPTTTTTSKNLTVMFEYNSNLSKWNLVASALEA